MQIDYVYAAVFVSDMNLSESFYAKVIGREPNDKPMPTLVQWRDVSSNAGIQLFLDPSKCGKSQMTVVIADLDKTRNQLTQAGIKTSEPIIGDFGKIAFINDPDGNIVVLAEPPKPNN